MEQGSLTVIIAFFAGVLAFFSPCQLPLLPIYLGFLAGSAAECGHTVKNRVLFNSLYFVTGFSLVFILLGVVASWFSVFFITYRVLLQRVAGLLIILFGLHLSGLLSPALLQREKRVRYTPRSAGPGSAMLMGIAFAAGWTPCVGPILGSILLVTATTGGGVSLLAAFSLGMALPYLLAALMVKQAGRWVDRLTGSLHRFQFVMGIILILFGVLIFMGLLTRLALIIV